MYVHKSVIQFPRLPFPVPLFYSQPFLLSTFFQSYIFISSSTSLLEHTYVTSKRFSPDAPPMIWKCFNLLKLSRKNADNKNQRSREKTFDILHFRSYLYSGKVFDSIYFGAWKDLLRCMIGDIKKETCDLSNVPCNLLCKANQYVQKGTRKAFS